ncbi:hypothetical protein [Lysinibacillus fusiformis]
MYRIMIIEDDEKIRQIVTDTLKKWQYDVVEVTATFFYAFILSSIVLLGFLLFRYQQNVHVIRQMKSEDYDSLSLEGELAKVHIDELQKQHIQYY